MNTSDYAHIHIWDSQDPPLISLMAS